MVMLFGIGFAGPGLAQGNVRTALPDCPRPTAAPESRLKTNAPNAHIASRGSEPDLHGTLDGLRAQLHLISEVNSKLPSGSLFQGPLANRHW